MQSVDGVQGHGSGAAGLLGFNDELAGIKGQHALGGKQGRQGNRLGGQGRQHGSIMLDGMRPPDKLESAPRHRAGHHHHGGQKLGHSGMSGRSGIGGLSVHHPHHPGHHGAHQSFDDKRKRHRRTATEIQRHFACPVVGCGKSYGSEGSMN